jgi:hypothetical protein
MHAMCFRVMSREEQLRSYCLRLKAERDSARAERDKARERLGKLTGEEQVEKSELETPSLKRTREEDAAVGGDEEATVWISRREGHAERTNTSTSPSTLGNEGNVLSAPPLSASSSLLVEPGSPSISTIRLPPMFFSADNPYMNDSSLGPPTPPPSVFVSDSSSPGNPAPPSASARCSKSPDGEPEDVGHNVRTAKRRRLSQEAEAPPHQGTDIALESDDEWQVIRKDSRKPVISDANGAVKTEPEDGELDELVDGDESQDSDSNVTAVDKSSSSPPYIPNSSTPCPPRSNISISHIDLLFQATPDKLICRMCLSVLLPSCL